MPAAWQPVGEDLVINFAGANLPTPGMNFTLFTYASHAITGQFGCECCVGLRWLLVA